MAETVDDWKCPHGEECRLSYEPMWGGYECYRKGCGRIGWMGLDENGDLVLYNDPAAAKKSTAYRTNK
jgi:hypothetical protein